MNRLPLRLLSVLDLRHEIPALWRAFRHPQTPLVAKAVLVAALVYVLSPFDLVTDFVPVLGWLDDIAVVPLAVALFKRLTVRAHLAID